MNLKQEEIVNSLIYFKPLVEQPTRYEMVRYSTWRIYFYQQLEAMPSQKITNLKTGVALVSALPTLATTNQENQFYNDFLAQKTVQTSKQDSISHFICRMLYCHETSNHSKFIEMEKLILTIRLQRNKSQEATSKLRQMGLLKKILAYYLQKKPEDFEVPQEDWEKYRHKITKKDFLFKNTDNIWEFAMVPVENGESGLKKRFSFVRKGNVYLNMENTLELVLNLYGATLKEKLQKMKVATLELLSKDVENQMNGFLKKTLDTLNTSNFDQTTINSEFKLNIKNIEGVWKKFFPPCMLNLNQRLKQYNHLKHEGRRQLWLFFKGCGMDASDNQAYFSKYLASKVSASEMKSHMYNIQHAYGLVGKKQPERPKICRNIITGPAPKKDEHHGCPFAHWRTEQLKEYLRKHYNISEPGLQEVIKQKQVNHFQVACGRLFEGVSKSEGVTDVPSDISNKLGRSPHEYFQAGMQLQNYTNTKGQEKKEKKASKPQKPLQKTQNDGLAF